MVVGTRGSVLTGFEPIATLDARTIAATGATTIAELLRTIRGVTQSADGSDPIFLLNAQRVSGYNEIGSLPPEAIEKVDVLPEPVALRYGYPPNRRVLNFITKRRFRQIELRGSGGVATRGANATGTAHAGVTRLHDDARLTANLDYTHAEPVSVSDRAILPDPNILFDPVGNVTGLLRGEIDPALSAIAGTAVTVAPVPGAAPSLADFAAGANRPRLFDLGPLRTLMPRSDTVKGEAVLADRLGAGITGSINLTGERKYERSLSGPAAATFVVPAGNPASPFTRDVLLQRYLTEAAPLRLNQTTTTLHAGMVLRGAISGWQWDLTAALDNKQTSGSVERAIDLAPAQAAIDAGDNPFAPLAPALVADRLVDRGRQRTRSANANTVATGSPFSLPGGSVQMTTTLEVQRDDSRSSTRGVTPFDLDLGRTRLEAGAALDVPVTSRRNDFIAAAGDLSLTAAATWRSVGGFGALWDTSWGLTWTPIDAIQVAGLVKTSEAAPAIEQQSTPVVRIPNAPVFDYATGRTSLATLVQGGNPDLMPEHRRVTSFAVNLKPFAKREWRLSATWSDTVIRNQTATVYAFTPRAEALLPQLIVRDASGEITSLVFQPINLAREHQRTLAITVNTSGQLGREPPAPAPGEPPKPPRARVTYYGGIGPTIRFTDRLQLRADTPALDLLGGDTITGTGSPRVSGYGYGGLNYLGNSLAFNFWYQQPTRVRSDLSAADLTFGSLFRLDLSGSISIHHFLPKQDWTRHLQVKLEVSNVTDAHVQVRDAAGNTPNRFQPDLLDPVGRTVTLTLRKLL